MTAFWNTRLLVTAAINDRSAFDSHLVFDSRLTTYAHLARLDALGITFITLRRRSSRLLDEINGFQAGRSAPTTTAV